MTENADLSSLLAVLDDVVSLHGLDGRLLEISSSCARLLGKERAELVGGTGLELAHPEDRERLLGLVRDLAAGLPVPETEWRCLSRTGNYLWISTLARLVRNDTGKPYGVVARSIDVSARKQAEARLRQEEKLAVVSRLAGGIAHEFNNLLTIISGYGEFLLEANPPGTPFHQSLSEIHRAAERAAALTRQLLAVSCRQMLAPSVLPLNPFLQRMRPELQQALGEGIRLRLMLAPSLWPLRVDPTQLEQALLETAHNARAAMPGGGELVVETANVVVGIPSHPQPPALPPGRYVRLIIRDTGPGMDARTLAHVFEPFFTTRPVGAGRGLGLAVVHGIVKQTGGFIEADSAPGAGTRLTIHLPALADSPAAEEQRAPTVLLVEDEPAVRRLAAQVLRSEGYEVLEAGSGAEAVHRHEKHAGAIDLLLTGLLMPGMAGSDLADTLLQRSPRLQVLFMTGYTTEKSLLGQSLYGRRPRFLPKPFRPADLLEMVRETLDAAE